MSSARLVYFIIIIIVMSFFIISGGDENKKNNLAMVLKDAFSGIYLARFSKDYPFTNDVLYYCIKNDNKLCLKIYHRVTNAKNTIISHASDESLEITLDIIESECLIKDGSQDGSQAFVYCYGGIMSLYFYNSSENDKYIKSRLKGYSKELILLIFDHNYLWYYNRPDSDLWVKYIEKVDVNWEYNGRVKDLIEIFNKDISEARGEPWVFM